MNLLDIISLISSIVSVVLAVVSIVLAVYSIRRAERINKETEKALESINKANEEARELLKSIKRENECLSKNLETTLDYMKALVQRVKQELSASNYGTENKANIQNRIDSERTRACVEDGNL